MLHIHDIPSKSDKIPFVSSESELIIFFSVCLSGKARNIMFYSSEKVILVFFL